MSWASYTETARASLRINAETFGGKGKLILIWGLPGHWSKSRREGVNIALKKYPGLKIVAQQRGDYVRDKGA